LWRGEKRGPVRFNLRITVTNKKNTGKRKLYSFKKEEAHPTRKIELGEREENEAKRSSFSVKEKKENRYCSLAILRRKRGGRRKPEKKEGSRLTHGFSVTIVGKREFVSEEGPLDFPFL